MSCNCSFYTKLTKELSSCLHYKHNYRCPKKRKTISCKENEPKFKCRIETNEIACLFVVDPQYSGNCKLNAPPSCLNTHKTCDFILYVRTGNGFKSVTFIELKGNKINEAIKQLKTTIQTFCRRFPKNQWGYKVFVVIIYTGSAPKDIKSKELKNLIDKFPFKLHRNSLDITDYVKTPT